MKIEQCQSKYGYHVSQIVYNKKDLFDSFGVIVLKNSPLRIVAITPKVFKTPKRNVDSFPDVYDNKEYFLNMVRAEQKDNFFKRIRENFITVSKIKQYNKYD